MTYLIIFRFLVDIMWSYKILSVAHAVVGGAFLFRRIKLGLVGGARAEDVLMLAFSVILTINFFIYPIGNLVDYVKLMSIPLFYFLGRFSQYDSVDFKILANISMISLLTLLVFSVVGVGYKEWGSYTTYTGGYYFKTDLALAVTIFLVFFLAYNILSNSTYPSIFIIVVSSYLIWISNARISLLSFVVVVFIFGWLRYRYRGYLFLTVWVSIISLFGVFMFQLYTGFSDGLSLDFSDFWSESNLQGRNWIWSALIQYYSEYGVFEKFVGAGFSADISATEAYSLALNLDNSRAHSSYLYLLVCLGWSGLAIVFLLLFFWGRTISSLIVRDPSALVFVAVALYAMFLIFSFTTEAIIRAQLMVPFSFFMGRVTLERASRRL